MNPSSEIESRSLGWLVLRFGSLLSGIDRVAWCHRPWFAPLPHFGLRRSSCCGFRGRGIGTCGLWMRVRGSCPGLNRDESWRTRSDMLH